MAALLQLSPVQGTSTVAMARLHPAVTTTLRQTAQRPRALVRRCALYAARLLAFRSHVALRRIPIPPH
jgi:hypothetical protein